ncbi:MAG: hypothetical protein LBH67_01700 [Rickettsia sp.]|jgi:hypothetical protein|nr:hypothetical protein [Rickettsia sp.]
MRFRDKLLEEAKSIKEGLAKDIKDLRRGIHDAISNQVISKKLKELMRICLMR